ncbi:MAG: hypothetical protein QW255_03025 [Candidatus Bilamarchaeaceae archaeon]
MVCLLSMFTSKEKLNIDMIKDDFVKARNQLETVSLLNYNEFSQKQEAVVEAIIKLRDFIVSGVALEPNEKIDLVRLINQAKIKSAALGTPEGYRTFQILDSISEDIRKYL